MPTVLLISTLLTTGYLLPPSITAFFGGFGDGEAVSALPKAEPSRVMLVPIMILTAAIIYLGVSPGIIINVFDRLAQTLL